MPYITLKFLQNPISLPTPSRDRLEKNVDYDDLAMLIINDNIDRI